MAIRLIIQGIRRSGTTIFWQTFRQDPSLLCFDEPFNGLLHRLPEKGTLKHPEEFIELLRRDPRAFWESFATIHLTEELRPGLSDHQAAWLRRLGDSAENVVLDTTRCHFKLDDLRALAPDAVLVHLWRPPASHATSHLLPSGAGRRGSLRKTIHRVGFWTRRSGYNGWSLEAIIGTSPLSLFARRLEEVGLDPEEIYRLPAVARLMAYWRVSYERVEADGPRLFGERFVSQCFDDFCADPRNSIVEIYRRMGLDCPELDYSRVHPPNGPHDAGNAEWSRYTELLGIPQLVRR